MYDQYNIDKFKYTKMYNYYVGKTDIDKYTKTDRSNNKINDNFVKTFIDEEVSFMVGAPITYSSLNVDVINDINYNLSNACIDTKLANNMLIFGEAYEFYYLNSDGDFSVKVFNPLNSYCYEDTEEKAQLFMYFYKKDLDEKIYIEVIDDEFIYHLDDSFNQIENPTPHIFKHVPVGIAKLANGLEDTIYASIKSLQDAYEILLSDWSNEISDTRLAYLMFTGGEVDEKSAKLMKELGIIQSPEPNAKVEYIVKNINSDFYNTYRNLLKEDIYRAAQHIDNQTQVQSNTSGSMLATRLNCLRIKITTQNQSLVFCIKERIKNLFIYLSATQNKLYDFKEIQIKPQLNLPKNDVEVAQIISQLNGKISTRTAIEQLSFITNGQAEYDKMLEEEKLRNEADPNLVSLDRLNDEEESKVI